MVPQRFLWNRIQSRLRKQWPAWMALLAAARCELEDLNQATEQDFLHVEEKLQSFLEISSLISEQCSQLV